MGDSTRPEVDSVVRLNRLRELYEKNDFVESVQEAMKEDVSDNQKKDVRITFGPNDMNDKFAKCDIQWPFAVFVIDFAGKCNVHQVRTVFEECLEDHIKSQNYGEKSGLVVCCDRAKESHKLYTFYVLDRILLKESLEGIVESYAQGGERGDILEAIIKCHEKTPDSLELDIHTRNNVIVQIVSFTQWIGHICRIPKKKIIWPEGTKEVLKYIRKPGTLKRETAQALRKSQKKLLDYTFGQPHAIRSVENTQNVANAANSSVIETGIQSQTHSVLPIQSGNDSGPGAKRKRRRSADNDRGTLMSDSSPIQYGDVHRYSNGMHGNVSGNLPGGQMLNISAVSESNTGMQSRPEISNLFFPVYDCTTPASHQRLGRSADNDLSTMKIDTSSIQYGSNHNQWEHGQSVEGNGDDYRYLLGDTFDNFVPCDNPSGQPNNESRSIQGEWFSQLNALPYIPLDGYLHSHEDTIFSDI